MSEEIKPGSWRSVEGLEPDPYQRPEAEIKERPPETHERLVRDYKLFNEVFHLNPNVVYHPSGANDVSPSAAFPNSRVIYVEIDQASVMGLTAAGYEAHYASASAPIPGKPEIPTYQPDTNVDLLILLNPHISHKIPAESVREGGYVMCNDYHGNATAIKAEENFEFMGAIEAGREFVDPQKAEDYWQVVKNDEEFKKAHVGWGALHGIIDYKQAKAIVEKIKGPTNNVLETYNEILSEARIAHAKWKEGMAKTHPGMEDLDLGENFALPFHVDGELQPIDLPVHLPTKGGDVDDFFIFKKIKQ